MMMIEFRRTRHAEGRMLLSSIQLSLIETTEAVGGLEAQARMRRLHWRKKCDCNLLEL